MNTKLIIYKIEKLILISKYLFGILCGSTKSSDPFCIRDYKYLYLLDFSKTFWRLSNFIILKHLKTKTTTQKFLKTRAALEAERSQFSEKQKEKLCQSTFNNGSSR